ncbi:hypothetical protein [Nostoc sp. CHAB 5715]|uniref:hypothetical protein n=1 Tax=Nostoc sp. CHAB 5715 TaxID=2780400 RepID=UPI001E3130D5|nr:hypothetical protein [Nostoc sp. CHAB 5715]
MMVSDSKRFIKKLERALNDGSAIDDADDTPEPSVDRQLRVWAIHSEKFLSDRISRLWENENLEDAPSAMLKYLGELKRPYLTEFEEELLSFIEAKAGASIGDVQDS